MRTVKGPDGAPVMEDRIATRGKSKGKPVKQPKREPVTEADGKVIYKESRRWYVEYRDAQGIRRRVPGYADKQATQQLAAELERQAAREQSGLIDRFAVHRKRPLIEHVSDWHGALLDKGVTTT